jgi:hypothetical protein
LRVVQKPALRRTQFDWEKDERNAAKFLVAVNETRVKSTKAVCVIVIAEVVFETNKGPTLHRMQ